MFPANPFEITNGGIGKVRLGDSFNDLDKKYTQIDTLTMSSEGVSWPAKKIKLERGLWILVENNNGPEMDAITRIHTNSPAFKTANGIRVGQKLFDIPKTGDVLQVNIDEGILSIYLEKAGIAVSIDEKSENSFYESNNQEMEDIPKNAVITEISIF